MKLSDLIENPDNPQTVTDEDFADLVKSIRQDPETLAVNKIAYQTDYASPISGESFAGHRVVIAGNKRLRALVTIHGLDAEMPDEYFFDLTPLDPEKRRRWLVRSNTLAGEWDVDKLLKLYTKDELSDMLSGDELDKILSAADSKTEEGKTDPDAAPAVDASGTPRSIRGGVYQLGAHRLMCGDSTSIPDVAKLMHGELADVLLTDPPYNVNYESSTGKIENDNMSDAKFFEFLCSAFAAGNSALRPGGVFYIWHADGSSYSFRSAVNKTGWEVRECLIWVKNALVLGRQDYQSRHEPCLYGWKEGAAHTWRGGRKQTTVMELIPESVEEDKEAGVVRFHVGGRTFEIESSAVVESVDTSVIPMDKPAASKLHPTMKPVAMFEYQIRNSSAPGEIVLDLFGGSGTTAIACQCTGRLARLMELDPKYCDVIRRRWAEYLYGEGCDWEKLTPEVKA